MDITFTSQDILMAEFEITSDFQIRNNLPIIANQWVQAWTCGATAVYFIIMIDKNTERKNVLLATPDAIISSTYFKGIVDELGYSTETQINHALDSYSNLLKKRPPF